MNIYIDFDNTLYETAKLTEHMLNNITNVILLNPTNQSVVESIVGSYDSDDVLGYVKANFDSTNDNIFTYGKSLADKFDCDKDDVVNAINNAINNGRDIVFPDARMFLMKLKEEGHKIFILTFLPKTNQEYQMQKICGSGLASFFDGIIMSTEYKFNLDINYSEGIFIDDDPRDLKGLLEKNPIRVIRIRKPNNKRSKIDINNSQIEEYTTFADIEV